MRILNLISALTGLLSKLYLPVILRYPSFVIFARLYGINLDEVELPLDRYRNFAEFFTRNLKIGCRNLGHGLLIPADSLLIDAGVIDHNRMIGIKGCNYSIPELIISTYAASQFLSGTFFNYYLAPRDYHHVHSPISGKIVKRIYIPGNLYPVTKTFVSFFSDLYARQERVVLIIEGEDENKYALVMIGAFNVGSIGLEYDKNFRSNKLEISKSEEIYYHDAIIIKAGEKLGTFYLGSTVVLISSNKINLADLNIKVGSKVKYGESI